MNPLKPMIMKMPSQCLRGGVKCGGGSQVGGRMTAAVTTTRACRKHCQKSKSLKIKSNLFAKTPKTLGGCMDCGSGGGMVGSGVTHKLKCETHAKWHEDDDELTQSGSYKQSWWWCRNLKQKCTQQHTFGGCEQKW